MSSVTVVQYKLVPSHAVSHKEDQNVSASVSLVKHAVPVKVSLEVDGDMQPAHITIFTVTCEARVKEISEWKMGGREGGGVTDAFLKKHESNTTLTKAEQTELH